MSEIKNDYETWTVEKYNSTILKYESYKIYYLIGIVITMIVAGMLFPGAITPHSKVGYDLRWLTIFWLWGIPFLALTFMIYFGWFSSSNFLLPTSLIADRNYGTVEFQITSTGVNVKTVLHTIRSTQYWTSKRKDVCYTPQIVLILEEFGYNQHKKIYDELVNENVKIVVTSAEYETPNKSIRKARAMQNAVEQRRKRTKDLTKTWIYHQDDETAIGEDTVISIDQFIKENYGNPAGAAGIILYPQHADDFRPSQIAEFHRSADDIRVVYALTKKANILSGFHGSHYIIRADVEDSIGFDIGAGQTSEDFAYEVRIRATYGGIFKVLRSFAYEQAPLDYKDQLKQRRRWFQGWWKIAFKLKMPASRRAVNLYSMGTWMVGVLALTTMFLSWAFKFGTLYTFSGFVGGFVWSSMVIRYHQGWLLTKPYIEKKAEIGKMVLNGIFGALIDGIAPWYAIFSEKPKEFQVINKDKI